VAFYPFLGAFVPLALTSWVVRKQFHKHLADAPRVKIKTIAEVCHSVIVKPHFGPRHPISSLEDFTTLFGSRRSKTPHLHRKLLFGEKFNEKTSRKVNAHIQVLRKSESSDTGSGSMNHQRAYLSGVLHAPNYKQLEKVQNFLHQAYRFARARLSDFKRTLTSGSVSETTSVIAWLIF
jgi:hypothetical protein